MNNDLLLNNYEINQNEFMFFTAYFQQLYGYVPYERYSIININGVLPNTYIISSYGRIFLVNSHRELRLINHNGYRRVSIRLEDGGSRAFSIHTLVATAFIPKTEEDIRLGRNQVNHKDRCRSNNCEWNLEWNTAKENVDHAIMNGDRQKFIRPFTFIEVAKHKALGEDVGPSRLTNNQVHIICQCLELNKTYQECCDAAGLEYSNENISIISNIRTGRRWQHISSKYHIIKKDPITDYVPYIIPVCELLEKGYMIKTIVEELQLPGTYDCARVFVGKIKNRKTYTDISSKYTF